MIPAVALRERAACLHCGSAVPDDSPRPDYCCRGCEVVHALLVDQGLTRYYDLAAGQTAPAEPPRDRGFAWLDPLVERAEASGGGDVCSLAVDVQGVHCAACVWLMNELFRRRAGGAGITVNPALGKVRLAWRRGRFDVAGFLGEVERFGYLFGPDRKRAEAASRELPIRIGVCAAITINVMMFSVSFYLGLADGSLFTLFSRLTVLLSAVVVLVGGQPFFRSAWRAAVRGVLHLDLPIAMGILLAFGASFVQARSGRGDRAYFDTLNVFVLLMLFGRWMQQRAVERNRRFLVEDDGVDGLTVRRREGARIETVPAPRVRAGDLLMIAPGDLVPVDGVLIDERASFATDWITGEPEVRTVGRGEIVAAGWWSAGRSAVTVRAETAFAASPLPALLRTVADGGDDRDGGGVPAHARFFDRYARVFVVAVLTIAAGAALVWWRIDPARAMDVTVAVLVVTCPCAVGLAAPLAVELALARLRRAGFFVKSGDLLDRLTRVRKVLFDKTGTLTLGRLALVGGDRLDGLSPALRDAAYDMACRSNHPVSRCLAEALGRSGARFSPDALVVEEPGAGLELVRDGRRYRLGRPAWAVTAANAARAIESARQDQRVDGTTVMSIDGAPVATFVTDEEVRSDARREIAALAAGGQQIWLISGDAPERVELFAAALGIDPMCALGGQRPEDKAAAVKLIDVRDTLFVGDGVNDSLAFGAALCAGTTAIDRPVLPGKSDFFLLGDGVGAIREALAMAHRLRHVLRRNLALATAYNSLAVIACLAGWMTPLRAALAMPASSIALLLITSSSLTKRKSQRSPSVAPSAPLEEPA